MYQLNLAKLAPLAPLGLGAIAFETGTFLGRGARFLAGHFPKVVTIELSEELHREAAVNLAAFGNVECLQGNSAEVLARILPSFPPDQTAFFFLDAHWSGDRSVDWERSGWKGYRRDTAHLGRGISPSGPEQCPLLEELTAIRNLWAGPAHLLIDDMKNIPAEGPGKKSFAFAGEDWSHLSRSSLILAMGDRLQSAHTLQNPDQLFFTMSRMLSACAT
jgi:hypothetical protein